MLERFVLEACPAGNYGQSNDKRLSFLPLH